MAVGMEQCMMHMCVIGTERVKQTYLGPFGSMEPSFSCSIFLYRQFLEPDSPL